ncbi:unnamed protein product [Rotaria sp. Silwood1]|nr:unnamed protein product [Rotaria sp. Silwood1]CAF1556741.1 unnamed protein product [Rotaria sp. Silwood1]CAF3620408.1 unnamed protein product [Rotaria sp. Silwood1]CAF3644117.1 unnamed protein product [Rotaria sp. Silwood1]CAF3721765.1 unnamed protein product [Rotaria sp. Silwood1]
MKSNSWKQKTISSFFSSFAAKKQKTDDQTLNASSISAETQTVLSETSNLVSTVGASGSGGIDSIVTCGHDISKISSLSSTSLTSILTSSSISISTSHSLPDLSSQLVSEFNNNYSSFKFHYNFLFI